MLLSGIGPLSPTPLYWPSLHELPTLLQPLMFPNLIRLFNSVSAKLTRLHAAPNNYGPFNPQVGSSGIGCNRMTLIYLSPPLAACSCPCSSRWSTACAASSWSWFLSTATPSTLWWESRWHFLVRPFTTSASTCRPRPDRPSSRSYLVGC